MQTCLHRNVCIACCLQVTHKMLHQNCCYWTKSAVNSTARQHWLSQCSSQGMLHSMKRQCSCHCEEILLSMHGPAYEHTGDTSAVHAVHLHLGDAHVGSLVAWLGRQLEEMLNRLQPEGCTASNIRGGAGQGDNDPTTTTLHEAMERLSGQHLSGSGEGSEGGALLTPAGARWPQGRSPPIQARKLAMLPAIIAQSAHRYICWCKLHLDPS